MASGSHTSTAYDVVPQESDNSTSVNLDSGTNCWGCGLPVLVSPYAYAPKCAWCGAILNQRAIKSDNTCFRWRRLQDRCFLGFIALFMLFFICGGIWAVFPVLFSIGYFFGFLNLAIAVLLSISTVSSFCLAAFRPAGTPPTPVWGSFHEVVKGGLENYTFCYYCSKPKSPRAHHCRSCRKCILDMDHHCPLIGNCVGAANHRAFILFLISTSISTVYAAILTSYVARYIWPHLDHRPASFLKALVNNEQILGAISDNFFAFLGSLMFLSERGLVLVYICFTSAFLGICVTVLLLHQLFCIYNGKTYLSYLIADSEETAEKGCQNLVRFFGFSSAIYLPSHSKSRKRH